MRFLPTIRLQLSQKQHRKFIQLYNYISDISVDSEMHIFGINEIFEPSKGANIFVRIVNCSMLCSKQIYFSILHIETRVEYSCTEVSDSIYRTILAKLFRRGIELHLAEYQSND